MGWDGKKYVKGGGVFVYVYEREAQMGFSFLSFIYIHSRFTSHAV